MHAMHGSSNAHGTQLMLHILHLQVICNSLFCPQPVPPCSLQHHFLLCLPDAETSCWSRLFIHSIANVFLVALLGAVHLKEGADLQLTRQHLLRLISPHACRLPLHNATAFTSRGTRAGWPVRFRQCEQCDCPKSTQVMHRADGMM